MVDRTDRSQPEENYAAIRQDAEEAISNELGPADRVEPGLEELEDLETELGLEEVDLDQAVIDTVAVDDTDDNLDADDDGIVDETDDEENVSNLPQDLTQSYGTGLQGKPSDRAGRFSRREPHLQNEPDFVLTGGDVDANYEDANAVGEESVGGTVATPDQDVVDELAAAVGVEIDDYTDVRINDMLEERDDRRWELEPSSSEDYEDRRSE